MPAPSTNRKHKLLAPSLRNIGSAKSTRTLAQAAAARAAAAAAKAQAEAAIRARRSRAIQNAGRDAAMRAARQSAAQQRKDAQNRAAAQARVLARKLMERAAKEAARRGLALQRQAVHQRRMQEQSAVLARQRQLVAVNKDAQNYQRDMESLAQNRAAAMRGIGGGQYVRDALRNQSHALATVRKLQQQRVAAGRQRAYDRLGQQTQSVFQSLAPENSLLLQGLSRFNKDLANGTRTGGTPKAGPATPQQMLETIQRNLRAKNIVSQAEERVKNINITRYKAYDVTDFRTGKGLEGELDDLNEEARASGGTSVSLDEMQAIGDAYGKYYNRVQDKVVDFVERADKLRERIESSKAGSRQRERLIQKYLDMFESKEFKRLEKEQKRLSVSHLEFVTKYDETYKMVQAPLIRQIQLDALGFQEYMRAGGKSEEDFLGQALLPARNPGNVGMVWRTRTPEEYFEFDKARRLVLDKAKLNFYNSRARVATHVQGTEEFKDLANWKKTHFDSEGNPFTDESFDKFLSQDHGQALSGIARDLIAEWDRKHPEMQQIFINGPLKANDPLALDIFKWMDKNEAIIEDAKAKSKGKITPDQLVMLAAEMMQRERNEVREAYKDKVYALLGTNNPGVLGETMTLPVIEGALNFVTGLGGSVTSAWRLIFGDVDMGSLQQIPDPDAPNGYRVVRVMMTPEQRAQNKKDRDDFFAAIASGDGARALREINRFGSQMFGVQGGVGNLVGSLVLDPGNVVPLNFFKYGARVRRALQVNSETAGLNKLQRAGLITSEFMSVSEETLKRDKEFTELVAEFAGKDIQDVKRSIREQLAGITDPGAAKFVIDKTLEDLGLTITPAQYNQLNGLVEDIIRKELAGSPLLAGAKGDVQRSKEYANKIASEKAIVNAERKKRVLAAQAAAKQEGAAQRAVAEAAANAQRAKREVEAAEEAVRIARQEAMDLQTNRALKAIRDAEKAAEDAKVGATEEAIARGEQSRRAASAARRVEEEAEDAKAQLEVLRAEAAEDSATEVVKMADRALREAEEAVASAKAAREAIEKAAGGKRQLLMDERSVRARQRARDRAEAAAKEKAMQAQRERAEIGAKRLREEEAAKRKAAREERKAKIEKARTESGGRPVVEPIVQRRPHSSAERKQIEQFKNEYRANPENQGRDPTVNQIADFIDGVRADKGEVHQRLDEIDPVEYTDPDTLTGALVRRYRKTAPKDASEIQWVDTSIVRNSDEAMEMRAILDEPSIGRADKARAYHRLRQMAHDEAQLTFVNDVDGVVPVRFRTQHMGGRTASDEARIRELIVEADRLRAESAAASRAAGKPVVARRKKGTSPLSDKAARGKPKEREFRATRVYMDSDGRLHDLGADDPAEQTFEQTLKTGHESVLSAPDISADLANYLDPSINQSHQWYAPFVGNGAAHTIMDVKYIDVHGVVHKNIGDYLWFGGLKTPKAAVDLFTVLAARLGGREGSFAFKEIGQELFEIFHALRVNKGLPDIAAQVENMHDVALEFASAVITKENADSVLMARTWLLMESRAGLAIALPHDVVNAMFREIAIVKGLVPELALGMFPGAYKTAAPVRIMGLQKNLAAVGEQGFGVIHSPKATFKELRETLAVGLTGRGVRPMTTKQLVAHMFGFIHWGIDKKGGILGGNSPRHVVIEHMVNHLRQGGRGELLRKNLHVLLNSKSMSPQMKSDIRQYLSPEAFDDTVDMLLGVRGAKMKMSRTHPLYWPMRNLLNEEVEVGWRKAASFNGPVSRYPIDNWRLNISMHMVQLQKNIREVGDDWVFVAQRMLPSMSPKQAKWYFGVVHKEEFDAWRSTLFTTPDDGLEAYLGTPQGRFWTEVGLAPDLVTIRRMRDEEPIGDISFSKWEQLNWEQTDLEDLERHIGSSRDPESGVTRIRVIEGQQLNVAEGSGRVDAVFVDIDRMARSLESWEKWAKAARHNASIERATGVSAIPDDDVLRAVPEFVGDVVQRARRGQSIETERVNTPTFIAKTERDAVERQFDFGMEVLDLLFRSGMSAADHAAVKEIWEELIVKSQMRGVNKTLHSRLLAAFEERVAAKVAKPVRRSSSVVPVAPVNSTNREFLQEMSTRADIPNRADDPNLGNMDDPVGYADFRAELEALHARNVDRGMPQPATIIETGTQPVSTGRLRRFQDQEALTGTEGVIQREMDAGNVEASQAANIRVGLERGAEEGTGGAMLPGRSSTAPPEPVHIEQPRPALESQPAVPDEQMIGLRAKALQRQMLAQHDLVWLQRKKEGLERQLVGLTNIMPRYKELAQELYDVNLAIRYHTLKDKPGRWLSLGSIKAVSKRLVDRYAKEAEKYIRPESLIFRVAHLNQIPVEMVRAWGRRLYKSEVHQGAEFGDGTRQYVLRKEAVDAFDPADWNRLNEHVRKKVRDVQAEAQTKLRVPGLIDDAAASDDPVFQVWRDSDPLVLDAKQTALDEYAAITGKPKLTVDEYDQIRSILEPVVGRDRRTQKLYRDHTLPDGTLDQAGFDQALAEATAKEGREQLIAMAVYNPKASIEDIWESFVAKYEMDGVLRDVRSAITPLQDHVMRRMISHISGGVDASDDVAMSSFLRSQGTDVPLDKRYKFAEHQEKKGAWSRRQATQIMANQQPWSVDQEMDYWMANYRMLPPWLTESALRDGTMFHDYALYQQVNTANGSFNRDAQAQATLTGQLQGLTPHDYAAGKTVTRADGTVEVLLKATRDKEAQRAWAIGRFGDRVYDSSTGRMTAMPWLMNREELVHYYPDALKNGLREQGFIVDGPVFDALEKAVKAEMSRRMPKFVEAVADVRFGARSRILSGMSATESLEIAARELNESLHEFASIVASEMMTTRAYQDFLRGDLPARVLDVFSQVWRGQVLTQLGFLVSNMVDGPLKTLVFGAGMAGDLGKSARVFYEGEWLTRAGDDIVPNLDSIGEGTFTTLSYAAQREPLRTRLRRPRRGNIAFDLRQDVGAFLNVFSSGLAPMAGKFENFAKLRLAQQMAGGLWRDYGDRLLKLTGGDVEAAELMIRRIVKKRINQFYPTLENAGALEKMLNEISPFLSYTFKNHIVWMREFLQHPVWFSRLENIQQYIAEKNIEAWEKSGNREKYGDLPDNFKTNLNFEAGGRIWNVDLSIFSDGARALLPVTQPKKTLQKHITEWIRFGSPAQWAVSNLVTDGLGITGRLAWVPILDAKGNPTGRYEQKRIHVGAPWSGKDATLAEILWPVGPLQFMQKALEGGKITDEDVIRMTSKLMMFSEFGSIGPDQALLHTWADMVAADEDAANKWLKSTPEGARLLEIFKAKGLLPRDTWFDPVKMALLDNEATRPEQLRKAWMMSLTNEEREGLFESWDKLSEIDEEYRRLVDLHGFLTMEQNGWKRARRWEQYRLNPNLWMADAFGRDSAAWDVFKPISWVDDDVDQWYALLDQTSDMVDREEAEKMKAAWLKAHPAAAQRLLQEASMLDKANRSVLERVDRLMDVLDNTKKRITAAKEIKDYETIGMDYDLQGMTYDALEADSFGTQGKPRQTDSPGFMGKALSFFERAERNRTPEEKAKAREMEKYGKFMKSVIDASTKKNGEFDGLKYYKLMQAAPADIMKIFAEQNPEVIIKWNQGKKYSKLMSRYAMLARKGKWDMANAYFDSLPDWVKQRYYDNNPGKAKQHRESAQYMQYMKRWVGLMDTNKRAAYKYFDSMPDWVKDRYYAKHPGNRMSRQRFSKYQGHLDKMFAFMDKKDWDSAERTWNQFPEWVRNKYLADNPDSGLRNGFGGGGGSSDARYRQYGKAMKQWIEVGNTKGAAAAKAYFNSLPNWMQEQYLKRHPDKRLMQQDNRMIRFLQDYFLADPAAQARMVSENPRLAQWINENDSESERMNAITYLYRTLPNDAWVKRVFREKYPEVFSPEAVGERSIESTLAKLAEHSELADAWLAQLAKIWEGANAALAHQLAAPKQVEMVRKKRHRGRNSWSAKDVAAHSKKHLVMQVGA